MREHVLTCLLQYTLHMRSVAGRDELSGEPSRRHPPTLLPVDNHAHSFLRVVEREASSVAEIEDTLLRDDRADNGSQLCD